VEGGLKARSTRGAISQTWWSGRFIAVLESIIVGGRLGRGRNYARRGQVISLNVAPGMVRALVQGSRVQPYRVRVGLIAFGNREWAALERALAGSAWYSAKLLAGEMPEDIEEVFGGTGLALFPASSDELSMHCSCPDWEVPCKHIAAVFYLLAEAFDEDPFEILAWRGRGREELLAGLHAARREAAGKTVGGTAAAAAPPGRGVAAAGRSGAARDRAGAEATRGIGAPGADAGRTSGAGGARAGRTGRHGGAIGAGAGDREGLDPLPDSPGAFFALAAPMRVARPPAASGACLLDQLPPVDLVVRGRPLPELLRPAYAAFTGPEAPADGDPRP
jgi:uncharacterized Zn finger protein